jgi:hypothetical protein
MKVWCTKKGNGDILAIERAIRLSIERAIRLSDLVGVLQYTSSTWVTTDFHLKRGTNRS